MGFAAEIRKKPPDKGWQNCWILEILMGFCGLKRSGYDAFCPSEFMAAVGAGVVVIIVAAAAVDFLPAVGAIDVVEAVAAGDGF